MGFIQLQKIIQWFRLGTSLGYSLPGESMKYDDQKREEDLDIVHDAIMKVETIEAHQLHVVSQWYVHPLLSKSLYKVGSITVVVENSSKVMIFRGEVISTISLNQEIDWDQRYFDKIQTAFDAQGKELKYSFKPTDEQNPSDFDYTLKVSDKIYLPGQKKQVLSEVMVIKVRVKQQPTPSIVEPLFAMFKEINNRKRNSLIAHTATIKTLHEQRQDMIEEMAQTNRLRREHELTITNKFVTLLNAKKLKIRELFQLREIPNHIEQIEQLTNEVTRKQDTLQKKASQSTKTPDLPGTSSYYDMSSSQIVGSTPQWSSLFEPTMPGRKPAPTKNEPLKIEAEVEADDLVMLNNEIDHADLIDLADEPRKKHKLR